MYAAYVNQSWCELMELGFRALCYFGSPLPPVFSVPGGAVDLDLLLAVAGT